MRIIIIKLCIGIYIIFLPFFIEAKELLSLGEEKLFQFSYDFGSVIEGEEIIHTFEILNNSQYLWRIEDILTSCECVSAELIKSYDKKNNNIPAGRVFRVKVKINSAGHEGSLEQFVYIKISQADEVKILKLVIKGEVLKK
jgi:hypothetical protein